MQKLTITGLGKDAPVFLNGLFVANNERLIAEINSVEMKAYYCDLSTLAAQGVTDCDQFAFGLMEEVTARVILYSRVLNDCKFDTENDSFGHPIAVSSDRILQDVAFTLEGRQTYIEGVIGINKLPITLFSESRFTAGKSHSEILMMTLRRLFGYGLLAKYNDSMVFGPTRKLIHGLAKAARSNQS